MSDEVRFLITEEMVQAGVEVLWNSGALDVETDADREIVREIYQAMVLAADLQHLMRLKESAVCQSFYECQQ